MKYILLPTLLFLFQNCSNEKTHTDYNTTGEEASTNTVINKEASVSFPHYKDVITMLEESHDFSGEGQLKLISKKPLYIQVSKPCVENDIDNVLLEQTKRDIIYVAFETFAMTDINEIIISSVPIYNNKIYNEKFRMKATITRQKASQLLEKYLHYTSFKSLFYQDGSLYLPNESFDKLKFEKLDEVFAELNQ